MSMLRAEAGSGATYDDPSEDVLFMLIEDIDRNAEQCAIVTRTSDASGQTYAQVIKNGPNDWTVERRDGGPDAHYSVGVTSMREAHAILTCWAYDLPQVPPPNWIRLEF